MPKLNSTWVSKISGLMSGRGSLARGSEGGSLIEFAMILPAMLLLITGMVWFGIALNNYIVLTSAVGSGARALALTRNQTTPALAATDPCAYAVQIANAAVPTLNTGNITYSVNWTTYNSSGAAVTSSYTNSCPGVVLNASDSISLSAAYPFTAMIYGWKPTQMNITAQTSELVQ